MNIQLKPMRLTLAVHENTWDKIVTDFEGNIIYQQLGLILFPEQRTKEYFDEWEAQMRQIPSLNIVEVQRDL